MIRKRFMGTTAALFLAAALTAAAPAAAFAAVPENGYAAENTDILSRPCPAGLEPDLWEMAKTNVQLYDAAIRTNLEAVNALRASLHLNELALDPELCLVASYRAAQINKDRYVTHYNDAGEYLADKVVKAVTGDPEMSVGENYYYEPCDWARKHRDPADGALSNSLGLVTDGMTWLSNSSGHYVNLTDKAFTRMGIGVYLSPEEQPVLDTMVQIYK